VDGSGSLLFFEHALVSSQSFSVLSLADGLEVGFILGHLSEGGLVSSSLSSVHSLLFCVLMSEGGLVASGNLGGVIFVVSALLGDSSVVSSDLFGVLLHRSVMGTFSLENQSFVCCGLFGENGFMGTVGLGFCLIESGFVGTVSVCFSFSGDNSGFSFSSKDGDSLSSTSLNLVNTSGMGFLGTGSLGKTDLVGLGSSSFLGLSHHCFHLLLKSLGVGVNLLHLQSLHHLSLHVLGSGLGLL